MNTKLITAAVTLSMSMLATTGVQAATTMSDGLAVVVNDSAILKSEIANAVAQTRQQYQAAGQMTPSTQTLQNEVIDNLVTQQLQLQLVRHSDYKPNDTLVNQRLLEIAQAQGWSGLAELQDKMNAKGAGSYEQLRQSVVEQLSVQALQQNRVSSRVVIPESEVDALLASSAGDQIRAAGNVIIPQWHTRHILIKVDGTQSNDVAKQKIDSIYKTINEGQDFTSMASTYSDDPGSAKQGGDLDWVSEGMMVPEFEQAMKTTPAKQVSKPFRTSYGWHILQVTDTRTQDVTAKAQRNMARDMIYQQKAPQAYNEWINELKSNAFVRMFN